LKLTQPAPVLPPCIDQLSADDAEHRYDKRYPHGNLS
jgi:hypothetical protein